MTRVNLSPLLTPAEVDEAFRRVAAGVPEPEVLADLDAQVRAHLREMADLAPVAREEVTA